MMIDMATKPATHPSTTVPRFTALARPDLRAVEAKMRESTIEQNSDLTAALEHLLAAGGKRVRPMVSMLAARAFNAPYERSLNIAAAVEMLHTATLVHDDLIDGALLRRGHATLNAQWSPASTVLTGDFVFARAAELAAHAESVRVMNIFAHALMVIVNGELNQMFKGKRQASRELYFQRIYGKTASLFEVAAQAPAILSDADESQVAAMQLYGREVGMAFQIVDDILDFTGSESHVGKPVGSDLRQGLVTLPVLCYLELHPKDGDVSALLNGHSGDGGLINAVVNKVRNSGAIDAAFVEARTYIIRANAALEMAPDNEYRHALAELGEYFVSRDN
jgi:geranylgeranyl pyrophosphate synthase